MSYRSVNLLSILSMLSLTNPVAFSKNGANLETLRFEEIATFIEDELDRQGSKDVLVVFDIDNTILRPKGNLGTEQWINWQIDLLKTVPNSSALAADTLERLFVRQDWLLTVAGVIPVQSIIPFELKKMRETGAQIMSLTSRGPRTRDYTVQQFKANDMSLKSVSPVSTNLGVAYLPYDAAHPEDSGLSAADMQLIGNKPAKPVIYDHGVLLTEGQHKGVMLKAFLATLKEQPKSVVFVDDRSHHIEGMHAVFLDHPVEVHTIRYTHMLSTIERFNASDKAVEIKAWNAFKKGICTSIPTAMPDQC